jgi:hypothetical protein
LLKGITDRAISGILLVLLALRNLRQLLTSGHMLVGATKDENES